MTQTTGSMNIKADAMEQKSPLTIEFLPLDDPAFGRMSVRAGANNVEEAELRERTGIEPVISEDFYPGADVRCEAYPCRLGDGFAFGILRGLDGSAEGQVEFSTDRADQMAIIALALGLSDGWFDWQCEPDPAIDRAWHVIRQDDNGNRFELARFANESDAMLYARLWDERVGAHKQTVFVSRDRD